MTRAEAIDKLADGIDQLQIEFKESLQIKDEGLDIMVMMVQILKSMQQNLEDQKVSIEAEQSIGSATQERQSTVHFPTQSDLISENMKSIYGGVAKDLHKVENTMEIIFVGVVDWEDTPSVCQNVSMNWFSYFDMLMYSNCILNHILPQEKIVRLGRPPAKPPDYVLLHFGVICEKVHSVIVRNGYESLVFAQNEMVHVYASCGHVESAHKLFVLMHEKCLVSWIVFIVEMALNGFGLEALWLFQEMKK